MYTVHSLFATPCTQLVYYTEHVTEQVNFRALLTCGYTIALLPSTKSAIFFRIPKWSLFCRITAELCLLALSQVLTGTIERRTEAFRVGISFITMKNEALGSYNEDTKIARYL